MLHRTGYIALIGRPNAGKSTLLNRILGQKIAITSNKPQTTRNALLGICHRLQSQMLFLDTPGLPETDLSVLLNRRMVKTLKETVRASDLLLVLTTPKTYNDPFLWDLIKKHETPKILAINKIDLMAKSDLIPLLNGLSTQVRMDDFSDIVPISAKTGENIETLLNVAESYLPERAPLFSEEEVTDQPVRFLSAEILREKVIAATKEEIPYVVAAQVDSYRENEKGIIVIGATLFVEKESQKKILIGHKGKQLKEIGSAARQDIEALVGKKVFLEIWVKVKKDWRQNDAFLKQSGYSTYTLNRWPLSDPP